MADTAARLYLQGALEELFPSLPVYYRPPGDVILTRPYIVYTILQREPAYANNKPYSVGTRFQITFVSDLPGLFDLDVMFDIPNVVVTSNNSHAANDIAHDIFTVTINTI